MFGVQIDQSFTDKMIDLAIEACAEEHFAGDPRRMRRALLQGQCEHCSCLATSLVHQIAEYLGQVDHTVKAIYEYRPSFDEDLSTPFDQDRGALKEHTGINLVAWVERKSAALSALIENLEKALMQSQLKIGCLKAAPSCFTLDVQLVDNRDVNERRGYGLLVEAPALRVRQVWERMTPVQPLLVEHKTAAGPVGFSLPDAFDPELIPESRLIDHAYAIERIPVQDRSPLEHHLMDLKVSLIRRMISEHLAYIDIAKRWFTINDLDHIYHRRIGFGRIGGKSAGMLLAARILNETAEDEIRASLQVPESYFLGSDLIYIFMSMNGLMYWNDQKYKSEPKIRAEYPQILEEFQKGSFPPEILDEFRELLENIGAQPLIVRSSSQLEDNFGTSFAGKYDSYFLPNQGTAEENLATFTNAIAQIYASTLKPEALLYRRSKNLQDYDERMAVLIQAVQGEKFGRYYLPHGSGVGFSHNIFRWSPQIRREDGFARLVWGLGTRAVQRLGDDYPRLVALSHPNLLPDDSPEAIRHYSQQCVDLIDLQENELKTLPVHEVLTAGYPPLRLIAQLEQDGFFVTPRMRVRASDISRLAINFQDFLKRSNFAPMLTKILRLLEVNFHTSVDIEFTLHLPDPNAAKPAVLLTLLQCRPQSYLAESLPVHPPQDLPEEDIIFSTRFMVPRGHLKELRYVLFVAPEAYLSLPSTEKRAQVSQTIAQLNNVLGEKTFICVGPGRWGSTNLDLGVYVSYADIHHAAALVEITGRGIGPAPEPSLGTHFFQDLMEASIYPLALSLDDESVRFNRGFFYQSPNAIHQFVKVERPIAECIRLIDIRAYHPGHHLELIMDDVSGEALAYLVEDTPSTRP